MAKFINRGKMVLLKSQKLPLVPDLTKKVTVVPDISKYFVIGQKNGNTK
jgi:hypothetical protein